MHVFAPADEYEPAGHAPEHEDVVAPAEPYLPAVQYVHAENPDEDHRPAGHWYGVGEREAEYGQ